MFALLEVLFCVSTVMLHTLKGFASSLRSSWILPLSFCVASGLENVTGATTSLNSCFQIVHIHCSSESLWLLYTTV